MQQSDAGQGVLLDACRSRFTNENAVEAEAL
jgi:hypothetical protein